MTTNSAVTSSNSNAVMASEIARLRGTLRRLEAILTKKIEGEAWSQKIADAVPVIREALK